VKNLPESRSSATGAGLRRAILTVAALLLPLMAIGCGGKRQTALRVPPAPSMSADTGELPPAQPEAMPSAMPGNPPLADQSGALESVPGIHVDPNARVLWSEVGYASWYGGYYHGRKAANGEKYDQNELTAAHNTLPLNSIVRVTNLKNHESTVVRITDRGPFVADRIIDLSVAAAKAVGIYLPGTAKVRIDVLEAPRPIESGGRWCVQIGALSDQAEALELKDQLLERYAGAHVIQFKGPTGYWVRLRMPNDDKAKTRQVFDQTEVREGGVFMVRLD
jgi:rare lipoprotein A